jgi:hypothetical protein
MDTVLWILIVQGMLGAFDTIYFHEYRARLPELPAVRKELILHATRDFIYSIIFITLPWFAWKGRSAAVFVLLLAVEIIITMYDSVVEDTTRRDLGGVYPAERVTHAVMGIVYGVFLAQLLPVLKEWFSAPTSFHFEPASQTIARYVSTLMGLGVMASGIRDLVAALSPQKAFLPAKGILRLASLAQNDNPGITSKEG